MKPKAFFIWRLFNGLLVLAFIWGAASCASVRQQTQPDDELNTLQDISVADHPDETEIVVTGQKPLVYTSYLLTDPPRLIVDLAGASVGRFKDRLTIGQGAVTDLLPIEGEKPSNVVRLEITLSEAVLSHVRADGEKLFIGIEKPEGLPDGGEPPVQPEAPPPTETSQEMPVPPTPRVEEQPLLSEPSLQHAKTVSTLKLEPNGDKFTILITGDGMLKPDAFMVDGNRLVVDLSDVTSRIRPNTIPVKHRLLKRIRIGQHNKPKKVRVVFDLKSKVTFAVAQSGQQIAVTLTASEAVPLPIPAASKMETGQVSEEKAMEPTKEKIVEHKKAEAPPPVAEVAPSEAAKTVEPILQRKYTGRKISLDFQDADISNVLRLLADVSGLNIVISEDVKGKVTIKLINVPWDQALEIVLKMNNLGQVREGNIIRVATVANITKQQDDEARAKETKVRAEDLVTKVVYVNYAKAEDLVDPLKKNLSPRGDITIDKRTNTMIVKDINKHVNEVVALIKTLDTRTPQVQIEARIIQADTSFAQALGIQWGVGFSNISSNNISRVQGINTTSSAQPAFGAFTPDFSVNLPGSAEGLNSVPAIGFNFGRFTDNPINLDLRLSAGELNGLTKTISSPKVTTLDNVKAKIEQGESIPFQTTSQQGTQTTFVDANLTLEVTPHITADRSIIMKVKAARNSLGSFSGPAGPSISKREATTEVLVKDGETTVIGGIFVDERKNTTVGVPLLSRIPILGWLFKNESKLDTKNELLIFITPKIVQE
ncbi:MAG: type IV pilus secretin PilQ [Nitrospirae bacterium]|nr:type IV pilus secretin PilQ [Nitrospirota bacterium]